MMPNRSPAPQAPAIRALNALRKHSRDCRSLETREYLLGVERQLVQLIDLDRQHRDRSRIAR